VLSALGVTVLSFVLLPSWPLDWLAALRHTNHVPPVLRPYGWVLLLAFLRWRTPEGRLLGLLALVPQTTGLYEALALFLIPRTRWEGYGLAACSYGVAFVQGEWAYHLTIAQGMAERWPVIFVGLWLPALALVLRGDRLEGARRRGETRGMASRSPGMDRDPLSG
jgi:hypothetical protein